MGMFDALRARRIQQPIGVDPSRRPPFEGQLGSPFRSSRWPQASSVAEKPKTQDGQSQSFGNMLTSLLEGLGLSGSVTGQSELPLGPGGRNAPTPFPTVDSAAVRRLLQRLPESQRSSLLEMNDPRTFRILGMPFNEFNTLDMRQRRDVLREAIRRLGFGQNRAPIASRQTLVRNQLRRNQLEQLLRGVDPDAQMVLQLHDRLNKRS